MSHICVPKRTQIYTWRSYRNGSNLYKNTGAEYRIIIIDGRYFIERKSKFSDWEVMEEVNRLVSSNKYN